MARMFGTDGVRGVAGTELTIELAMKLGQAGAYVLTKEKAHQPTIIVGCDTRISGGMLANALMAGVCSVGANAVYMGVMPTPAIAYLTKKHKVDAGVVISASHNPMEFNGIKFFNGEGYKLSDELEDEIERLINNGMKDVPLPLGSGIGKISYRFDAREEYVFFMKKTVPVDLSGMKIVIDCAEGIWWQSIRTRTAQISMQTADRLTWMSCARGWFMRRQISELLLMGTPTECLRSMKRAIF